MQATRKATFSSKAKSSICENLGSSYGLVGPWPLEIKVAGEGSPCNSLDQPIVDAFSLYGGSLARQAMFGLCLLFLSEGQPKGLSSSLFNESLRPPIGGDPVDSSEHFDDPLLEKTT